MKLINDKRGESIPDILQGNIMYGLIIIFFLVGMIVFISSSRNNSSNMEDYYAKQISNTINSAKVGDKIIINVHEGVAVGVKNKVGVDEMFNFDNKKKKICVKFDSNSLSCYTYINDVNIVQSRVLVGEPINLLYLEIEKEKA